MRIMWLAIGVVALAGGVGATCQAEPLDNPQSIEELRREVAELRQAVADLREQIQQLEYQRLPRMRAQSDAARSAPPAQPSWLRFPIEVERAMMLPVGWPLRRAER